MAGEEAALRNAIEGLYTVFSAYPLADVVHACPCCHTDEDHARIHAKPLRELSAEDLDRFASDALTTWGDEEDLKHFLPRMLEILALEPNAFTLPEAMIGKLTYTGWKEKPYPTWHRWPAHERQALDTYFKAAWRYELTRPTAYRPQGEDWLLMLIHAYDDLSPFLSAWQHLAESDGAIVQLAHFVDWNRDELQRRRLAGVYWQEHPHQATQVVDWVMNYSTVQMLRRRLPDVIQHPVMVDCEITAERVAWYFDDAAKGT